MTVPLDEADEKALRVGRARIAQFDAAREGTRTAAESMLVSSLREAEFDEALLDVFEAVLSPETSGVDKAVAVARFRETAMSLNLRQTRRYLRDVEIIG